LFRQIGIHVLILVLLEQIITQILSRKNITSVGISRSFVGEEDVVRCHYCDGCLRHWEPGDIPWEKHARWFSFCKYVIKMKGRDFIDNIKAAHEVYFSTTSIRVFLSSFEIRYTVCFTKETSMPLIFVVNFSNFQSYRKPHFWYNR
jgi:hypothetical protein